MSEDKSSRVPIKITLGEIGTIEGEFIRFQAPRTAESILRAMPFKGRAAFRKEEVYFEIPIKLGSEKPMKKVSKGTIAYWPLGNAICFFFGESQPYSPVSVIGEMTENIDLFKNAKIGTLVKIELKE
jgi:hypothetical protein